MGTSDYNRFRSAIPLFIAVKVPETFYYSYNPAILRHFRFKFSLQEISGFSFSKREGFWKKRSACLA
jgi:hypothetical protein